MKLFSTLLFTLAAIGAAATSSTPKVVRTANKGVESSRQLNEQGTGNNSPTPATINRPNSYPTPYYPSYGYPSPSSHSSGGGSKPSPSKPHKKKPAAKKTKAPKKPKAKPHKPSSSSSHSSSSGHSSSYYSSGYGYDTYTTYSAVGALALVGAAATVLAKKVSSRGYR